jgi:hypothetical protein
VAIAGSFPGAAALLLLRWGGLRDAPMTFGPPSPTAGVMPWRWPHWGTVAVLVAQAPVWAG